MRAGQLPRQGRLQTHSYEPGNGVEIFLFGSLKTQPAKLLSDSLLGKETRCRMFCSRRLLQHWTVAVFLLCSPVSCCGRPIDPALTNRM
ncbi:parathyroid hormone-related protein-like [Arapaima gigas]